MTRTFDLVVIGAGPAGMAAAVEARALGLGVAVIDEQPRAGGQIYRQPGEPAPRALAALGEDYGAGRALIDRFRSSGVEHMPGTAVWNVGREGETCLREADLASADEAPFAKTGTASLRRRQVGVVRDGVAALVRARELIVAAGARERPVPVPGWTLPGVMTAGAAQVLLKGSGLVPRRPAVLAGSGPLLYLVAWQHLNAGAPPRALLETVPLRNYVSALPHLPRALGAVGELVKGLGWMRALRRAGVRLVRGVTALAIEGEAHCRAVSFSAKGRRQRIETDLVLLHEGVIPNVEITQALGCEHVWDEAQLAWRPRLGPWRETSVHAVAVAGDCGGIEGAAAAVLTGRLAALGALFRLGALSAEERDRRAPSVRLALGRVLRTRALLDRLYRPDTWVRVPADDGVIVCRCEEVTAGELRRVARLGALGLSQAKAYSRSGMGPCQGRMCGPTAGALIAAVRGVSEAEVEPYRSRPPLKPVTVGALARLSGP